MNLIIRFRISRTRARIQFYAGTVQAALREENRPMLRILAQWFMTAVALLITSRIVPGFHVHGIRPAIWAALIIGLLNVTIGFFLKVVTFPLTLLTFGLFLLVINALMILIASRLVRGFEIYGMGPAFWGAVVLALLGMVFRALVRES